MVRPEDVDRFRDLGVIASIQPSHCIDDMRWAEKRIGGRVKQAYLFNSFIKAGVHVAFGSDWFVESLNPLLGIYAAVTREYPEGGPEGGWFPEEKISLEKAIEMLHARFRLCRIPGERQGIITAGKLADLVVLDRDLFKISRKEILQTKVVMTILGGNIVFNKN